MKDKFKEFWLFNPTVELIKEIDDKYLEAEHILREAGVRR